MRAWWVIALITKIRRRLYIHHGQGERARVKQLIIQRLVKEIMLVWKGEFANISTITLLGLKEDEKDASGRGNMEQLLRLLSQ